MRSLPVRAPKGGKLGSAQASREGVTEFSLQIPPRGPVSQLTGQALEPCLPPECPSEALGAEDDRSPISMTGQDRLGPADRSGGKALLWVPLSGVGQSAQRRPVESEG